MPRPGTVSVFAPARDGAPLFDPDPFGDPIPVRLNERYVSIQLGASRFLERFDAAALAPSAAQAIARTQAAFVVPDNLQQIDAMPPGAIVTVERTGDLHFSGAVNLLSAINPLASASLPVAGALDIAGGASLKIAAGYRFSGDFQLRISRLEARRFRLGYYRRRQSDFTVTATAQGSVDATIEGHDLTGSLLRALGAGVPVSPTPALQAAVQSSIDRTLALGVSLELDAPAASEAMFLFEADLAALGDDGRKFLARALQGDLPLPAPTLPPGIQAIRTLITTEKPLTHTWKVTLLGVNNGLHVSSLGTAGAAAWDAASGELTLIDAASASQLGVEVLNFGAGSKRLRRLLSTSVLITAAWRASGSITAPPALAIHHTYFDSTVRTNRTQLRDRLLLGAGLGLMTPGEAMAKLPPGVEEFGQTVVNADVSYDDAAATALFQHSAGEYETAGRAAIQAIVPPGDPADYRLRPAQDDALWRKMLQIGNVASPEFASLFPDLPQPSISTIGADYLNVVWWRDAMLSAGAKLLAVRDTGHRDFEKRRRQLARQLAKVAKAAREDFGGPWGLVAMRLVASGAGTSLTVSNSLVAMRLENALPPG